MYFSKKLARGKPSPTRRRRPSPTRPRARASRVYLKRRRWLPRGGRGAGARRAGGGGAAAEEGQEAAEARTSCSRPLGMVQQLLIPFERLLEAVAASRGRSPASRRLVGVRLRE